MCDFFINPSFEIIIHLVNLEENHSNEFMFKQNMQCDCLVHGISICGMSCRCLFIGIQVSKNVRDIKRKANQLIKREYIKHDTFN